MNAHRRRILARTAAWASVALTGSSALFHAGAFARPVAPPARLAHTLRIFIPANAGGGWDQTGRALGAALVATGAADQIVYENVGGQGGTIGLARYAERYARDPDALMMGGLVMVGAVALQKPAVDLTQVQPIARLTTDFLVAVVPASSSIYTTKDLVAAMRADLSALPIAGGSAGGVDHIFAGVLARAAKSRAEALVYQPYPGGAEVVDALLTGRAAVGLSGYSEFSQAIAAGTLRAVGVSARRSMFGIPAFREQGLDAVMANWRGVFTGQGVAAARLADIVAAVQAATAHESWTNVLRTNRWDSAWLAGKDLANLIDMDLMTSGVVAHLLKLKA